VLKNNQEDLFFTDEKWFYLRKAPYMKNYYIKLNEDGSKRYRKNDPEIINKLHVSVARMMLKLKFPYHEIKIIN